MSHLTHIRINGLLDEDLQKLQFKSIFFDFRKDEEIRLQDLQNKVEKLCDQGLKSYDVPSLNGLIQRLIKDYRQEGCKRLQCLENDLESITNTTKMHNREYQVTIKTQVNNVIKTFKRDQDFKICDLEQQLSAVFSQRKTTDANNSGALNLFEGVLKDKIPISDLSLDIVPLYIDEVKEVVEGNPIKAEQLANEICTKAKVEDTVVIPDFSLNITPLHIDKDERVVEEKSIQRKRRTLFDEMCSKEKREKIVEDSYTEERREVSFANSCIRVNKEKLSDMGDTVTIPSFSLNLQPLLTNVDEQVVSGDYIREKRENVAEEMCSKEKREKIVEDSFTEEGREMSFASSGIMVKKEKLSDMGDTVTIPSFSLNLQPLFINVDEQVVPGDYIKEKRGKLVKEVCSKGRKEKIVENNCKVEKGGNKKDNKKREKKREKDAQNNLNKEKVKDLLLTKEKRGKGLRDNCTEDKKKEGEKVRLYIKNKAEKVFKKVYDVKKREYRIKRVDDNYFKNYEVFYSKQKNELHIKNAFVPNSQKRINQPRKMS